MCICTRDVGVLLSIESQFVLSGQVDKGLHGREVGNVSITDLTEQRLQVPAHTHIHTNTSSVWVLGLLPSIPFITDSILGTCQFLNFKTHNGFINKSVLCSVI